MEIQVLVEKVRSDWEQIFIEAEEDVRNIFFSNLDMHISMGIGLEVISVDETSYLAGKVYLICEDDNGLFKVVDDVLSDMTSPKLAVPSFGITYAWFSS